MRRLVLNLIVFGVLAFLIIGHAQFDFPKWLIYAWAFGTSIPILVVGKRRMDRRT